MNIIGVKCSLSGLVRLKPFDESEEKPKAGTIYADSIFFGVAIVASGLLSLAALALTLAESKHALDVLAGAAGLSAVTAGFEWHAGLKATALNQLFAVVLAALLFAAAVWLQPTGLPAPAQPVHTATN